MPLKDPDDLAENTGGTAGGRPRPVVGWRLGGEAGSEVVAEGVPEDVALVEESHTGRYLREML